MRELFSLRKLGVHPKNVAVEAILDAKITRKPSDDGRSVPNHAGDVRVDPLTDGETCPSLKPLQLPAFWDLLPAGAPRA